MAGDRLTLMLADPEAYTAEVRRQFDAATERDMARERARRRPPRPSLWRRWFRRGDA